MTARNSHLATLGLVRNPFPCTPDAGCYFSTPHLEEQMVELAHCIQARKGFCLLTAEVGMGKSTLVRRLMTDLSTRQVVSALVFNTFLQGPELLAAVLQDFGLPSTGELSTDIAELNIFLLKNHAQGKTCLLIIDDAQNLSENSLELIRLLCNLETDQEKLLQILLAGQPELETTLAQHSLRQLRSRLAKHARLHQLNSTEIADYVKFRFDSAGSDGAYVLQTDACQLLWKESQGVPRHIHLIMDRCLYGLAARHASVIDTGLMKQAIADSRVDLTGSERSNNETAAPRAFPRQWAYLAGLLGISVLMGAAWTRLDSQAHANSAAPAQALEAPISATLEAAEPREAHPPSEASVALFTPKVKETDPALQATASAADHPSGACRTDAVLPPNSMVISQPLPELTADQLGSRLAREDDVCLDLKNGERWITWRTPLNGHDTNKRLTAAQFQIALTHYGSLLPQEVDGLWGQRSQGALKQFQTALGLAPTGVVDALSGLLLERFYAEQK